MRPNKVVHPKVKLRDHEFILIFENYFVQLPIKKYNTIHVPETKTEAQTIYFPETTTSMNL